MTSIPRIFASLLVVATVAAPAAAQDRTVPYWASIRAEEVNMRVGPGEDYRIRWVYRREMLPLKVLRLKEGWRLVQDPDGTQGWMLARFLSRARGAIVAGDGPADMRETPGESAKLMWRLQPGVTGKLGDCAQGWGQFEVGPRLGYVRQTRLWGAGEP